MAFVFRFPARILGHLSALLLGDYQRDEHGNALKKNSFPGVLGLLLGGIELFSSGLRKAGLTITHLIKSTEGTLNAAFWFALFLGGAAALTVACWPAALALVVNYSIAGYSIAAIVGAEFAAQVLATGAAAAILSALSVFSLSAMGHSAWWLVSCCCGKKDTSVEQQADFPRNEQDNSFGSAQQLRGLGECRHVNNSANEQSAIDHFSSPLSSIKSTPIKSTSINHNALADVTGVLNMGVSSLGN